MSTSDSFTRRNDAAIQTLFIQTALLSLLKSIETVRSPETHTGDRVFLFAVLLSALPQVDQAQEVLRLPSARRAQPGEASTVQVLRQGRLRSTCHVQPTLEEMQTGSRKQHVTRAVATASFGF